MTDTLSVTIRWPVGEPGSYRCVTDFGEIEYSQPRPWLGEVGHLCLAGGDWVRKLLTDGPESKMAGAQVWSATADGDRVFVRLDWNPGHGLPAGSWTWEMFDAHWADDQKHQAVMVGRWPD